MMRSGKGAVLSVLVASTLALVGVAATAAEDTAVVTAEDTAEVTAEDTAEDTATAPVARTVYRVVLQAPITTAAADIIDSAIGQAERAGAAALVVELDTPGGALNATQTIVKSILGSGVPVVIYVSPRGAGAISAGVFVTMAAHVAGMAPGTTIGAAHPVGGSGEDIGGDMREKVENFAVSFVESIAEHRGRNVEWAAKAVRESVAITEQEAVEEGVVDFVADDLGALLRSARGKEVDVDGRTVTLDFSEAFDASGEPRIVEVELTLRQRVLRVITDPTIVPILMMLGTLGLYIEFTNPGAIFPGVAGAICLILAMLAMQVLPISSTGVLLIVVGMAFLLGEVFLPSFGALGFGGLIAITLGSLFLYTPESSLVVDYAVLLPTVAGCGVVLGALVLLLARDRTRKAVSGEEGLIGEVGVAVTAIAAGGEGKVRVHGEFWNASSDEAIEEKRSVRVEGIHGLKIRVRALEE